MVTFIENHAKAKLEIGKWVLFIKSSEISKLNLHPGISKLPKLFIFLNQGLAFSSVGFEVTELV